MVKTLPYQQEMLPNDELFLEIDGLQLNERAEDRLPATHFTTAKSSSTSSTTDSSIST